MGATVWATRKAQLLLAEVSHRGRRRACALEDLEQVGDALAHLAVGVEHDMVCRIIDQTDRQRCLQRAAARLVEDAAAQAGAQHVQLSVGHGALQPQEKPVVEVLRAVDPVFIDNQRVGQRADLQQPVPVCGVARQARDLEPEHDAGMSHAHLAHELLETFPVDARCPGLAKVAVDHPDPLHRPAQRHRPLPQGVLAQGALGVLEHLPHRGLAHVQVGVAPQVALGHFLMDW